MSCGELVRAPSDITRSHGRERLGLLRGAAGRHGPQATCRPEGRRAAVRSAASASTARRRRAGCSNDTPDCFEAASHTAVSYTAVFKKKKSVNAFRSHYPRRPEVFRRIYHGTRDPVCFSLSLFPLCPSGGNKNMSVDNASCKSAPLSFPALRCVSPDLLADLPVFLFPQTSISKGSKGEGCVHVPFGMW